jgi:proline iminopeptidase
MEQYPERVTEMVSFGVTTGRHKEIDWLFRGGVAIFFPEQWDRLRNALPEAERDGDILGAYNRQLNNPELAVRQRAAESWCLWESATLDWPPLTRLAQRFTNHTYALAFARIVTHYTHHNLFLEDGILLREADVLASIPGILVNARFDFQAPIGNAWELKRVWPRAELVIVDNAGHAPDNPNVTQELIRATDRFARFR